MPAANNANSSAARQAVKSEAEYEEEGEEMESLTIPPDEDEDPGGSPARRCDCLSSPIMVFLEELLSPGLLLSPTFICLLLSNVFTMWGELMDTVDIKNPTYIKLLVRVQKVFLIFIQIEYLMLNVLGVPHVSLIHVIVGVFPIESTKIFHLVLSVFCVRKIN